MTANLFIDLARYESMLGNKGKRKARRAKMGRSQSNKSLKVQKRVRARIESFEAMCKDRSDHGRGFRRPGSNKKPFSLKGV